MAENNSKTLYQALWNSADILRSKMDANDYKNYLLGLVFYKYLSDNLLYYVADLLEVPTTDLQIAQSSYVKAYADEETREELLEELKDEFSYTIEPHLTFTALVNNIDEKNFS